MICNDCLNFFPQVVWWWFILLGPWDIKLLVRILEKEDGLTGPIFIKKKARTVYFQSRPCEACLEDCCCSASLSSTKFSFSRQASVHQFSLLSRHINLSCEFPGVRGQRGQKAEELHASLTLALAVLQSVPVPDPLRPGKPQRKAAHTRLWCIRGGPPTREDGTPKLANLQCIGRKRVPFHPLPQDLRRRLQLEMRPLKRWVG